MTSLAVVEETVSQNRDFYLAVGTVLVVSILAPMLQNRARKRERRDDWERIEQTNKETREAAEKVAKLAKESSQSQGLQLFQIHKLVNNDMTTQIHNELRALEDGIHALERYIELSKENGYQPTFNDLNALEMKKHRLYDVKMILKERGLNQAAVDAETQRVERETGRTSNPLGGLNDI